MAPLRYPRHLPSPMDQPTHADRWRTLVVLCLSFFSIGLDNSKLVAAAPTLARGLGAQTALVEWVLEASLLVYASLLLLGGGLAERFGPRNMLLTGIGIFGGGSCLAAACEPGLALVFARGVMGVGAALMTPSTLAALKHTFAEHERASAISMWTASYGMGAAIGPVASGFLLEKWGLWAVLLANLPALLLAFFGAMRLVPADSPRRAAPLDLVGTALSFAGTSSLLIAILHGPSLGFSHPAMRAAAGGAVVLLSALFAWERRTPHPMLEPALFRLPRFAFTLLVILLAYLAFSGMAALVAQYWQLARSYRAFASGVLSIPLTVSMLTGTLLAPMAMKRLGSERTLIASLLLAAAGASLLALGTEGLNDILFAAAEVPLGAGCGSAFANATELIMGSVPAERAGSAAAVSEAAFEFGGVLGIAVLGAAPLAARNHGFAAAAARSMGIGVMALLASTCVAGLLAWRMSRQALGQPAGLGVGNHEPRRPDDQVSLGRVGSGEDRGAEGGAGDPT
jgi:MFS family permease